MNVKMLSDGIPSCNLASTCYLEGYGMLIVGYLMVVYMVVGMSKVGVSFLISVLSGLVRALPCASEILRPFHLVGC